MRNESTRVGDVTAGGGTTVDVYCPSGTVATGGGGRAVRSTDSTIILGSGIASTNPLCADSTVISNGQQAIGWRTAMYYGMDATDVQVDAYAICIPTTGPNATPQIPTIQENSVNGLTVTARGSQTVDVMCPSGYVATGGGGRAVRASDNTIIRGSSIAAGRPLYADGTVTPNGQQPTGWRTGMYFMQDASDVNVTSYVVCIPVF